MTLEVPETLIRHFIAEDLGDGDVTANIIPVTTLAKAQVITREPMLLCGQIWFDAIFAYLDPAVVIDWQHPEGSVVPENTLLCQLQGPARALLTGERTALNILQSLSATATLSKRYADAVAGTGCKVLDTRKTIPGLRQAQKYAVKCGGCENHRMGLYDAVLIKENHIIASGSIANAVCAARATTKAWIEVEVESLTQLQEALEAQPERIMLDNFSIEDLQTAVKIVAGRVELEASGNIRLDNIREIAETGVDYISIGALTKDIKAIDLSMRIQLES